MTKADVMVNYLKQMQKLKVKDFSAAQFGAIVDKLGAANYKADASLVSTNNAIELENVYKNYAADELKMTDKDAGMKLIKKVALKMKAEKRKYRAVFYYLLKTAAGK